MSTPAAKRRRLDAASTLSKPFKSPFKTPLKSSNESGETDLDAGSQTKDSPKDAIASITTAPQRPISTPHSKSSPLPLSLRSDSDILALQRQHSALLSTLTTLRADLDTHTQALKIETSGKDIEIERLVGVWKTASRLAAEELFGGVRDRVNRMGGVGAWKERERNKNTGFGGWWDEAEKKGQQDGEGDEEDKAMLREEMEGKVDVDTREEGARRVVEEGNDDDVSRRRIRCVRS